SLREVNETYSLAFNDCFSKANQRLEDAGLLRLDVVAHVHCAENGGGRLALRGSSFDLATQDSYVPQHVHQAVPRNVLCFPSDMATSDQLGADSGLILPL